MANKLSESDAEAIELLRRAGLSSGPVVSHQGPQTRQELRTFLQMARVAMPPLQAWKAIREYVDDYGVAPEDSEIPRFMVKRPKAPEDLLDRLNLLLRVEPPCGHGLPTQAREATYLSRGRVRIGSNVIFFDQSRGSRNRSPG